MSPSPTCSKQRIDYAEIAKLLEKWISPEKPARECTAAAAWRVEKDALIQLNRELREKYNECQKKLALLDALLFGSLDLKEDLWVFNN